MTPQSCIFTFMENHKSFSHWQTKYENVKNVPHYHREHSKTNARIAFLNADWREFRGKSAMDEDPKQSILLSDYIKLLKRSGWEITHIIDCPMSSQRFKPNQVSRMQKNRILGIVRRSLIIGKKV